MVARGKKVLSTGMTTDGSMNDKIDIQKPFGASRRKKRKVLDFDILENNNYIPSRCFWDKGVYVQEVSRSYNLWQSIKARCKGLGNNSSYLNVTNQFESYQYFAKWCNSQYGYLIKDSNGKFWEIDKDLLVEGSTEYSPKTCTFVPHRINSLIKTSTAGDLPEGVYLYKCNKYRAQVSGGQNRYLGTFSTPELAHFAYIEGKLRVVESLILTEEDEHVRVILNLVKQRLNIRRQKHVDSGFDGDETSWSDRSESS